MQKRAGKVKVEPTPTEIRILLLESLVMRQDILLKLPVDSTDHNRGYQEGYAECLRTVIRDIGNNEWGGRS